MYTWSKLRNLLLPTAQQAIEAMTRADDASLTARDQRMLMFSLMRLTRAIARIGSNLNTRKTALTAFSWNITAMDPAQQPDATRASVRLAATINKLLSWHTDTVAYGSMVVRLAYTNDSSLGNILRVDKRYLPTEIDRPAGISDASELYVLKEGLIRAPEPLLALMLASPQGYLADIDDNYEPGGLLRDLLLKGIASVMMEREWVNTARKVKGLLEVIYAPDAPDDEIASAITAVQDAATKNISSHSKDIEIKTSDIGNTGAALQTFSQFLARLDNDFSVKILGQANTTQLPNNGGSRAALQILQMITADISWSDIQRMTALINKLLLYDYQLNKDTAATSTPWTFQIAIPEASSPESVSRVVQTMLASGVPLRASEVYNGIGFSNPDPTVTVIGLQPEPTPVL